VVKTFEVDKATLGFSPGEIYLRFGEAVIILPPAAAKRLVLDLEKLPLPASTNMGHEKGGNRQETVAKQVMKALYKSHKLTKSLISVNTNRRKKLPDRG
jgi:hypothetical protein